MINTSQDISSNLHELSKQSNLTSTEQFFKQEIEICQEKPLILKSDELKTVSNRVKDWSPTSAVFYLPKQNIIIYSIPDKQFMNLRIHEAVAPYTFIN